MAFNRDEIVKKKRKKRLTRIVIIFLVVVFVIGLSSFISYRKSLRISKIELSGGVLVTEADVEKKSLEYLYGSYFLLFPKGSAFWYPKEKLEKYLKENFKRIETISVSLKGFNTLSVVISERKPFAIWCDGGVDIEKCYFMDDNGTLFSEAPYFSGDVYFKYYGLISSTTQTIGSEYLASSTQFADISNFVFNVRKLGTNPLYIFGGSDGDFSLVFSNEAKIYFDTKEPLQKTFSNLEALLETKPFSETSDPTSQVNYIDLRFGNKLFYKLK